MTGKANKLDEKDKNETKKETDSKNVKDKAPDIQDSKNASKTVSNQVDFNTNSSHTNKNEGKITVKDNKKKENSKTEVKKFAGVIDNQDEEEDVPGDFFDDFLKEDFMAGLDIVDEDEGEWEDEKPEKKEEKPVTKVNTAPVGKVGGRKKKQKIDHVEKFRQSPPGIKKPNKNKSLEKNKKHDNELRKLDKELEEIRRKKFKKPEKDKSSIDADEFDIRRDPEKTKRDIQLDKVKCAKDQEKKLITEKLNIVETGLVPPGMEMEADLDEVRRQERIERNKPPGDLRDRLRSLRSRSRSPAKIKKGRSVSPTKSIKKSPSKRSPKRKRTKSPKKEKTHKNDKNSRKEIDPKGEKITTRITALHRRSPKNARRERSPQKMDDERHIPNKSVLSHERSISRRSPLHRSRSYGRRTPLKRSRSNSPIRRSPPKRSRTRSPGYYRRLRISPPHRRRREFSFSPVNRRMRTPSRSRDRPLRREEKRSFLEELAEKLNETRPPPMIIHSQAPQMPQQINYGMPMPPQSIPAPVPAPAPVPPPSQPVFFQPPTQYDPYDQNFFIGNEPHPTGPSNFTNKRPPNQVSLNPVTIQPDNSPVFANSLNTPNSGMSSGKAMVKTTDPQEDIHKLFEDKKIRLSDFLAITAKPQVNSTSPAKLQEKIKVIQRCQEAIKILSAPEKKFTGPLVIHKTDLFKPFEGKYKSPLLKYPVIRLPFTTPSEKWDEDSSFTKFYQDLLHSIRIKKKISIVQKPVDPVKLPVEEIKVAPVVSAPSVPSIPPIKTKFPFVRERYPTKEMYPKFTQTDPRMSACKVCEERDNMVYLNVGVQCGDPKLSFSVSTQVNEGDFYSMIPKTQSLASLTPAQLLGKTIPPLDNYNAPSKSYDSFMNNRNSRAGDGFNTLQYSPPSPPMHFNPTRDEIPSLFSSTFSPVPLKHQFHPGQMPLRGKPMAPPAPRRRF